jgi:predicted  nucleic acid-binding Zn-ribbon protein
MYLPSGGFKGNFMFDTLKYAEALKATGVNEEQAKGQARALADALEESFITKADLLETKSDLRAEIVAVKTDLQHEIVAVKTDLQEIKAKLEARIGRLEGKVNLLQWMVGFNTALLVLVLGILLRGL